MQEIKMVLHCAVFAKSLENVKVLLREGAEVNATQYVTGCTPLHSACKIGGAGVEIIKDLVKAGAAKMQMYKSAIPAPDSACTIRIPLANLGLGSVDKILEKPYKSSNKIEKTHKNLSSFIKSGKNAPKIFNFTNKTLNQMTLFVDMLIVIPLHFSIPFGFVG